jgi:hypothetical protein
VPSATESILNYIRAKDGNHPRLMRHAFVADATLTMKVRTNAIAFPALSTGIDAITDVLVRRFAQTYENVFTFCLADAPSPDASAFACDWLVGMSEKNGGAVRVGYGRYDWIFDTHGECLAEQLEITIEVMQTLPPARLDAVMMWLSSLSYPFCAPALARRSMPVLDGLGPIADRLGRPSASGG